jgi:hypothetical protein
VERRRRPRAGGARVEVAVDEGLVAVPEVHAAARALAVDRRGEVGVVEACARALASAAGFARRAAGGREHSVAAQMCGAGRGPVANPHPSLLPHDRRVRVMAL